VWDTPVKDAWLYLITVLQDFQNVHFFFECRFNNGEDDPLIYELSIPTGDSYKITEEVQGNKVNKSFFEGQELKREEYVKYRTFKVWNTPYAKDTYCSGLALAEHEINSDHIFEYVIKGQDEWVEFFTTDEPRWTRVEKGTKVSDLIAGYLKEWGPDEEST
jgi:hypothetical protein